jgi:hypothetical protein
MALLALLRPGVTADRLTSVKSPQDMFAMIERLEGVLHSFAGQRPPLGLLQVQFLPGRDYALICTLADSATAPPHFMLGMFGGIHVADR